MSFFNEESMLFGGDYNPEQWPENTWQDDINKLKNAAINSATINVFSWALLQPTENSYNFKMLDKIISLLEKNKIKIILATSTAAIPAWMSKKYPSISRVDVNGIRQIQGKRHNACPNSKEFKRLAQDLVSELAKRYANSPMLTAWHISNEYEGYCYCEQCKDSFREWLKKKYKNLDTLNEQWISNFWSHTINSWEEIEPPMLTTDLFLNGKSVLSGLEIDYRRFQSESLLNNYLMERDTIKTFDTEHPFTTNLMGVKKDLDYFKWAKEMDFISWDNYPLPGTKASEIAMNHDLMRGLKHRPFMLMEQTPNQQNWYPFNKLKKPNEMRMLTYQAIAHGANGIGYFQLKQSRSGAEKFHGSVLGLGDSINSRTYKEISQLGRELSNLPLALRTAQTKAKVAILFDWESYWGLENSIGPIDDLSYVEEVQRFYRMFYNENINIDIISKTDSIDEYSIVVAPVLYMWNQEFTENVTHFVSKGGKFLTTYLSGIADESDRIFSEGYLAPLRDLLGIKVDERDARSKSELVSIVDKNNQEIGEANGVCELIIPETATTLAHYGNEVFYSEYATITVNEFKKGQAYYCGAALNENGLEYLVKEIMGVTCGQIKKNKDVEIIDYSTKDERFVYVINTTDRAQYVNSPLLYGMDILSGKQVSGEINLSNYAVMIINGK